MKRILRDSYANEPGDDIRGVGPYHSRVYPGSDAELDRMIQSSGHPAPWIGHGEDEATEESRAVAILRVFLHSLVHMGDRSRSIFFARLQGLEWHIIGSALLRGATAQAAQNEFRKTMEKFPELARAFPEKPKTKEKRNEKRNENG